jgi:hypothetical protein
MNLQESTTVFIFHTSISKFTLEKPDFEEFLKQSLRVTMETSGVLE